MKKDRQKVSVDTKSKENPFDGVDLVDRPRENEASTAVKSGKTESIEPSSM